MNESTQLEPYSKHLTQIGAISISQRMQGALNDGSFIVDDQETPRVEAL